MHYMKWIAGAIAGASMMVAATAASALTVGFAQTGHESDWRTAFSASMQSAAKAAGIDMKFSDADQKPENQVKAVHAFIAQRVDAIIIAPIVETGWDEVLKEAKDAKIPVFIVDRDVKVADRSPIVARIAADFHLEGKLAGAWLAQASQLGPWQAKHGSECNIVELQGTVGSSPAILRKKGFEDVMALFPYMHIVKSQSGDFTTTGGKEVMESFIKATDGLKGICAVWSHNDNMQLGAIQAMKEAGLHPGTDFLMVSVDGVPDEFKAMVAGEANASVELRSGIGPEIFAVIKGYLGGKHDYPKWVKIASTLHTQADAQHMIDWWAAQKKGG